MVLQIFYSFLFCFYKVIVRKYYFQGFLSDDCILAGALWRNLYMSKPVEPVHLNNAVRYTRATVSDLTNILASLVAVMIVKLCLKVDFVV